MRIRWRCYVYAERDEDHSYRYYATMMMRARAKDAVFKMPPRAYAIAFVAADRFDSYGACHY